MSCECYQIGGPWIDYDPECPIHGYEAQRLEKDRKSELDELRQEIADLKLEIQRLRKEKADK